MTMLFAGVNELLLAPNGHAAVAALCPFACGPRPWHFSDLMGRADDCDAGRSQRRAFNLRA